MRNYGYACINMGFSSRPKSQRITTNRTMIKRTFHEKGIGYASELALQNVRDLYKILQWNLENDIYFYRLSSDMIPWASEYEMEELPDYGLILAAMNRVVTTPGSDADETAFDTWQTGDFENAYSQLTQQVAALQRQLAEDRREQRSRVESALGGDAAPSRDEIREKNRVADANDSDDSEYGEAPEWDEKEVKAMQKEYQKFLKGSKATEKPWWSLGNRRTEK